MHMPRIFRSSTVVLLAGLTASCAIAPYESPTSGPTAAIFIETDSRPDILPLIYTSASCSGPKDAPYGRWIVVPANGSIAFRKPYPVGLNMCYAEGRFDVREGDRIRVRFSSLMRGMGMACGMTAAREGAPGSQAEAMRIRKACGE